MFSCPCSANFLASNVVLMGISALREAMMCEAGCRPLLIELSNCQFKRV